MTVLLLLVLGAAPAAVGQEEEGYWLLTATDTDVKESDDTQTYSFSVGSATQTLVAPDVGDRFVSTATWSQPNDTYRSGETVQLTLAVRIVEYVWNGTNDGYIHQGLNSVGDSVLARIEVAGLDYGGVTAGAINLTDANGEYYFSVRADSGTTVVSEAGGTVSAAFPAGHESGELKDVRVESHSGVARYTYMWVYGEAASTTTTTSTEPAGPALAKVTLVRWGEMPEFSRGGTVWTPLRDGQELSQSDLIRTGRDTRLILTFPDGSVFRVKSNTMLTVFSDGVQLHVGESWFNLRKQGQAFQVVTPTTVCGPLGTTFSVSVAEDGATTFRLSEGGLEVTAGGAVTTLAPGQMIHVDAAAVPGQVTAFDVEAHEAQWTADFSEEGGAPIGLIVGIVAGGLLCLGAAVFFIRRNKKAATPPSQGLLPDEPPPPPAP